MWKPSRRVLPTFAVVTIAGALLHGLHGCWPNPVTAIFSPVCGSVWEHVKLLFWPFLAGMLFLTRGGKKEARAPWALSLLIVCGLFLAVGGLLHGTVGVSSLVLDVILYLVLMMLGFALPRRLHKVGGAKWADLVFLVLIILGAAIVLFTFCPPAFCTIAVCPR